MSNPWFIWLLFPLLIFFARIADVAIGTMRIIFVVRGARMIAAILGFLEIMIWILVVRQVITGDANLLHLVAYAAGFAAGNLVGIEIESRLAIGLQTVRVITPAPTASLERDMLNHGIGATRIAATGLRGGNMTILFSTVQRRKVKDVMEIIERHLPRAFIAVEDVKSVREGHLPPGPPATPRRRLPPFGRPDK